MTDKTNPRLLLWKAIRASIPAGRAILEVYNSDFEVNIKSDDSPLTRADMESHNIITDQLKTTGIPILSEEGKNIPFEERSSWQMFWLVDPLDGTKEFVNRNGEFTVNIALIEDHYPIASVIYVPVTDVLYFGLPDSGAYKIENAGTVILDADNFENILAKGVKLPEPASDEKFTVVCSRSHMSPETEAYIKDLEEIHGELKYASRGSSLKLCMVAEGAADVYPRFAPTMEWDTAAGQAIAECAGAKVIDAMTRNRLRYNKTSLLNPWFIVSR